MTSGELTTIKSIQSDKKVDKGLSKDNRTKPMLTEMMFPSLEIRHGKGMEKVAKLKII